MGSSILAIFAFDAVAGAPVALPPVVVVGLVVAIAVALLVRAVVGIGAAASAPVHAPAGG